MLFIALRTINSPMKIETNIMLDEDKCYININMEGKTNNGIPTQRNYSEP